jgi:hypothetical protein
MELFGREPLPLFHTAAPLNFVTSLTRYFKTSRNDVILIVYIPLANEDANSSRR